VEALAAVLSLWWMLGKFNAFVDEVQEAYHRKSGLEPQIYVCKAEAGASEVYNSDTMGSHRKIKVES
jgi:hypothetical protein